MPYSSIDQLPPHVRNHLPPDAQRIFVAAFNNVYDQLEPGADEVRAFKTGWTAVKRKYEKREGKWVRKSTSGNKTAKTATKRVTKRAS